MNYEFSGKTKKILFGMMGIGALALVYAVVRGIPIQRVWANLLVDIFFFLTLAIGATFYIAQNYAAEASYAIVYKRVTEAITGFLPIGVLMLAVFLIMGFLGLNHIYPWMDKEACHKFLADGKTLNPHFDEDIAHKAPYFNTIFYWARFIFYFGGLLWARNLLRKRSLEADLTGDTNLHWKNITTSAGLLVLFGFITPVMVWDVIMSVDIHWYSTMFGWYVLAGFWCTSMVTILLFSLYVKEKGLLPEMNDNHVHDLSKWVFALSFLWTYTFFCQFMLIWYANIPEEVVYFHDRIDAMGYRPLFWIMFFINFSFPMLLLISRDAKRNATLLKIVCGILIFTHWLDIFVMVMPGTIGAGWRLFSPFELGLLIGFAGLFIFVVLTQLAKAPIIVQKDPYLDESKHLQI